MSIFIAFFAQAGNGQVVINEYSASNLASYPDEYNAYEDWIELYNTSSSAIDLSGYYLSDKSNNPTKWTIPTGTIIEGNNFIVFWASGRDMNKHTNFKLKQTKEITESIVFSDVNGDVIDELLLEKTQLEHSRGRTPDGGTWAIYKMPTLGYSNTVTNPSTTYAETPIIDVEAGFYDVPFDVTISAVPNATVRYTLDGSVPLESSPAYTDPIAITTTTVLKAKAFSNESGVLPSWVAYNTYFLNVTYSLPVISIASEELQLLLNGDKTYYPVGSFEMFDESGTRVSTGYGEFNSHGQDSWVNDQRSIDYITRDEMGYNYAIKRKLIGHSDRTSFQRIILRAAGDDNYPGIDSSALLRDIFTENLASLGGLSLDVRKGERCILYVDGIYWGVYSIREKVDDPDYTKYYYGQGKYDIDFIMTWGDTWVEYGNSNTMNSWNTFYDFVTTADMSIDSNYQKVLEQYDVESLVDYVLVNSFVVCTDWLNWNVGWWRGRDPEGDHQRWGYILWDEDATFNHYINYTDVPDESPDASPCYAEGLANNYSDPEGHMTILNALRANPEFEQYYISRYIDLANSTFSCDNMISLLDSMSGQISPEMPRHIQRWGGDMAEWEANVQKLRNFILDRCDAIPEGLNDCYELEGPYNVVLDVSPSDVGQIMINSLDIENYPWNGSYHGGVDIKLKANSTMTNYVFDHWELINHTVSPASNVKDVVLDLTMQDTIVAVFKFVSATDSLVINEINYHAASNFDSKDWIEFYNPHDYTVYIEGWVFKDNNDAHEFVFPTGTAIESHEYLVIVKDSVAFMEQYPDVNNFLGNFNFGLSNAGELLRLFNAEGALVDTVSYLDEDPWPAAADGDGPTLELKQMLLDNALPDNWKAWAGEHGTPGALNHGADATTFVKNDGLAYMIRPNPFEEQAILSISKDREFLIGELDVFDMMGRTIQHLSVDNAQHIVLDATKLSSGTYLFRFLESKGRVVVGRFIVND